MRDEKFCNRILYLYPFPRVFIALNFMKKHDNTKTKVYELMLISNDNWKKNFWKLFQDLQPFVGADGHGLLVGENGDVSMTSLIGGENPVHANSAAQMHRHHVVYTTDASGWMSFNISSHCNIQNPDMNFSRKYSNSIVSQKFSES